MPLLTQTFFTSAQKLRNVSLTSTAEVVVKTLRGVQFHDIPANERFV